MDEYMHHFDFGTGSSDTLFLVPFGALPIYEAKSIDKIDEKSLNYKKLRKKLP
jgi:hypothetical protein